MLRNLGDGAGRPKGPADAAANCPPEALGLIAASISFGALAQLRRVCTRWRRVSLRPTVEAFPEQTLAAAAKFAEFSANTDAARALAWLPRKPSPAFCRLLYDTVIKAAAAGRAAFVVAFFSVPVACSSRIDRVGLGQAALEVAASAGHAAVVATLVGSLVKDPCRGYNIGKVIRAAIYADRPQVIETVAALALCSSVVVQRAEFDYMVARDYSAVLRTLAREFRVQINALTSAPADYRRECVYVATANGNANVLEALATHYGVGPADVGDACALLAAANGRARVLDVLACKYKVKAPHTPAPPATATGTPFAKNALPAVLQTPTPTFVAIETARRANSAAPAVFKFSAARRGSCRILRDLHARGSGADDVRANNNQALRMAVAAGNPDILRSLHAFALTADDARVNNNEAICTAATHNYTAVLVMLHDLFGLNADDARANNNQALRAAAAAGRAKVLKILYKTYGLGADDARANDNEALRAAAAGGHTKVLNVLLNLYGLTADDARANNNQALRGAAGRGHFDVAEMLALRYGLTKADAQPCFRWAVRVGAGNDNRAKRALAVFASIFGLILREDARGSAKN